MAERRRPARKPVRARTSGVKLPGATIEQLVGEIPSAQLLRRGRDARVREVRTAPNGIEPGDLLVLDDRAMKPDAVHRALRTAVSRKAAAVARSHARADDAADSPLSVLRVADMPRARGIAASAVWGHPSFSVDVLVCVGERGPAAQCANMLWAQLREAFGGALVGWIDAPYVWPPARLIKCETLPQGGSGAPSLARSLAKMRDGRAEYVVLTRSWDALLDGSLHGTNLRAVVVVPSSKRAVKRSSAEWTARLAALTALGAPGYVVDLDDPFGKALHARLAPRHGSVYTVSVRGANPKAGAVAEHAGREGVLVRMGARRSFVPVNRAASAVLPLATMALLGGEELAARVEYTVPPGTPRHQIQPLLDRVRAINMAFAAGGKAPR